MFNILLDAAAQAGAQPTPPQAGGGLMGFLPFILIIVIFYFFMIRPQQKRQKELNKFRDELKKGDRVMTNGGLYAKIHEIKDQIIVLEIAKDVYVEFDKAAILQAPNKEQ